MGAIKNLLLEAPEIITYAEKYGVTRAKIRFGEAKTMYVLTREEEMIQWMA